MSFQVASDHVLQMKVHISSKNCLFDHITGLCKWFNLIQFLLFAPEFYVDLNSRYILSPHKGRTFKVCEKAFPVFV
jgi:hypothetical protein